MAKKTIKKTKKKSLTKKPAKKKAAAKSKISAKSTVRLGAVIPNFALPCTGGKTVSLESLKGKKVVLYFYPKDATPGCTIEGHEFSKLHEQFKKAGAEVYGVSRDSIESHEKFKGKQCYTIDLLSDAKEQLCKIFGVIKMKNMYGKQVQGIERSTFILDEQGQLIHEWRGVKAEGHAQQVLQFLTASH